MRKEVIPVEDDRLSVPWAAAMRPGRRPVVFVRRSDMWRLALYCRNGAENCPIMQAILAATAAQYAGSIGA